MASEVMPPADEIEEVFRERAGDPEDKVKVDINYNIIRQISAQLYTNPRRAIEELVCNSYDAGASVCYIQIPESTDDFLGVLDNGVSMDLDGLHWLWKVADSPKQQLGDDRIANDRKQIGKFGVGKLASFAVGKKLTHIATKDGVTRIISVSESEIQDAPSSNPPEFSVFRLPTEDAQEILQDYFEDRLPDPWENDWETWTLAIIDQIDEGKAGRELRPGNLDRMIRTALPISSKFQVYRDGKPITKRELEDDKKIVKVDIVENEDFQVRLQRSLKKFWRDQLSLEEGQELDEKYTNFELVEVQDPEDVNETIEAINIPELGPIFGHSFIYENTLTTGKRRQRGYHDHGFHVKVQGRVLNKEDALFGVSPRSHKYWNRFYSEVEISGLDEAILVQRNQVNEDRVETLLTREILKALFNFTRGLAEDIEESTTSYSPENFGKRLNTLSPYSAPLALDGLSDGRFPEQGVESIQVEFATYDEWDSLFDYDTDKNVIYINDEHPIFRALDEVANSPSQKFKHVFAESLAGEFLGLGYLKYHEVDPELLQEVQEILDDVLRTAVGYLRDEVEYLLNTLEETSFEGDEPFEEAIVDAFRSVRLSSRHQGGADDHDGILIIPRAGESNFRLSLEAKGKQEGDKVSHDDVKYSTVDQHRRERNCDHALVIAREFIVDGRGKNDRSQLLRQLDNWETISLMTLEGLETILRLHSQRRFTYDQLKEILTNNVGPQELIDFIEDQWQNSPDPGLTRLLLEATWEDQRHDDSMKPTIGAVTKTVRENGREVDRDDVEDILRAIQTMTGGMVTVTSDSFYVELKSDPDTILDELPRAQLD